MLSSYNLLNNKYEIGMSDIGWNLLAVLRIIFTDVTEISLWIRIFDDEIISVHNEIKVWSYLLKTARDKLAKMTTTLQEDQNLLKIRSHSFNTQTAILWRKNKKQIWTNLIQTAKHELNKYQT